MRRRFPVLTLGLLAFLVAGAAQAQTTTTTSSTTSTTIQACGMPASLDVWAINESGLPAVSVEIGGSLDGAAVTCRGGPALRTFYAATVVCAGAGLVRCTDAQGAPAHVDGLQPGAWVQRVEVTVPAESGAPANDPQRQARRAVVLAPSDARAAATTVVWTIYGFSRAITSDDPSVLRAGLGTAAIWTARHPGRHALVTLRPPGPILLDAVGCIPDETCDQSLTFPTAGVCLDGQRIVLDGSDDQGRRGAELGVGTRTQPVIRVYGQDIELRGLTLVGTTAGSSTQADTLNFMSTARRNLLVDSTVIGPSKGDGVGTCGGGSDPDANVIAGSVIRGAENKGVKANAGAAQVVTGSCIADNANGGIEATQGGRVIAVENVVQHNVPGSSQHGISAGGSGLTSQVTTHGNIVRFAGGRGLSVTDDASADFNDDYVARNQYTGAHVERSSRPDQTTEASFSGVALVCNKVAFVSGSCTSPAGRPCVDATDCDTGARCTQSFPAGVGLGVHVPAAGSCGCTAPPCPCAPPSVTLRQVALTRNRRTQAGANLLLDVPGAMLDAGQTQWEGCDSPGCDDAAEPAIRSTNISEADGAHVELLPLASSQSGTPSLTSVSPQRPRAGEIVRVYGSGFDAINGNALSTACQNPPARDADFCDPSEPALAQINRSAAGNRLRLFIGAQAWVLDVVAVTPTMLAFRMPVDCFAPASLELRRGSSTIRIAACNPDGCDGQPAGVACADDGNACTADVCDGAGACAHPAVAAGTRCRAAAGSCDVEEVCDGVGSPCPADAKHAAGSVCRAAADLCDRPETCNGAADACPEDTMREPTHICRTAVGPCDVSETCDGITPACPANRLRAAGDVCRAAAGECDSAETCDGRSGDCPGDGKSTAVCRAAAGPCDAEERCTGIFDVCPEDAVKRSGTVCRAAADVCDVAERCDGSGVACPVDALAGAGVTCRAAQDACDVVETCSGAAAACPADVQTSGLDAVACRLDTLEDLVAQACGPRRSRQAALVARATAAWQRVEEACGAGRPRPAVRRLRRVSGLLARLAKLVAPDRCLQGAGAPAVLAGHLQQVRDLGKTLPALCRR